MSDTEKKNTVAAAFIAGAGQAQKAKEKRIEETPKPKTVKNPADYIRLDLRPQSTREDLKSYVEKRAKEISHIENRNLSATGYIQDLIRADKQAYECKGKKTKRDELADLLKQVPDKDLKTIGEVIKAFCK